jgi:hypothetical protein
MLRDELVRLFRNFGQSADGQRFSDYEESLLRGGHFTADELAEAIAEERSESVERFLPPPGAIRARARSRREAVGGRPNLRSVDDLEAMADETIEALNHDYRAPVREHLDAGDPRTRRRARRRLIACGKWRGDRKAWEVLLECGDVTRDQVPLRIWPHETEILATKQLRALGRAGIYWHADVGAFASGVPDEPTCHEIELQGLDYPRGPDAAEIDAAYMGALTDEQRAAGDQPRRAKVVAIHAGGTRGGVVPVGSSEQPEKISSLLDEWMNERE